MKIRSGERTDSDGDSDSDGDGVLTVRVRMAEVGSAPSVIVME